MPPYRSSIRVHNPSWLIFHSKDLFEKALRQKDSSKLLYCCLELRNCLELVEFQLLLISLDPWEREQIYPIAKPRHGIDRANKKLKSLNEKFQVYCSSLFKVYGLNRVVYDFSRSIDLKNRLSDYVHCYTRSEDDLEFGSKYLKDAILIIKEALAFLEHSLSNGKGQYILQNISVKSLNENEAHKRIFQDWKDGKIKDEVELTAVLMEQKLKESTLKRIK